MSVSQLEAFRSKVSSDAKLQEQIKGGTNLLELANSNGFNFSQSELQQGLATLDATDADLSDFELEMVSGGTDKPSGHQNVGNY